jgi:hypothetical protein
MRVPSDLLKANYLRMKKYFHYFYLTLVVSYSSVYLFFLFRTFIIDGVLSYPLGELMINYSCGFIRRGLLGSIFLGISKISSIHIFNLYNYTTLVAQLVLFLFIVIRLYKTKLLNLLFLSSPVGILFVINNWGVFGFKDVYILLYTLLILMLLKNDFKFKNAFVFIAIIIGGLLHEPFLFFSAPYILLSIIANTQKNTFKIDRKQFASYFVALFLVEGVLYFSNNFNAQKVPCLYEQAMAELEKYPAKQKINLIDFKEPIKWIQKDLKYGIKETSYNYKEPYYLKWISLHALIILFTLILIITSIFDHRKILQFISKYKYWMIYLLISYVVIFYIALDWGRWFYLIVMNFILFLSINNKIIESNLKHKIALNPVIISIILILSSLIYVPQLYYRDFSKNPFNTIFYRIFVHVSESIL